MITNSSMTVYNKYVDPSSRSEKWQRSAVSKVLWESTSAATRLKSASVSTDLATIAIGFDQCANYLPPKSWVVSKTGKWTLQDGDMVVHGIVTDEITDEFTMSDLHNKYDDVLKISSVARMDQGSPNTHHYLVGVK